MVPNAVERLVVVLQGDVSDDVTGTEVSAVAVSVLGTGGLRNKNSTSDVTTALTMAVSGSWGAASQPRLLSQHGLLAIDYGGQAGLGVGDVLFVQFDQPVAQVAVTTKADIDRVLAFSYPGWATNYSGVWVSSYGFAITVMAGPSRDQRSAGNATAYSPGVFTVTVLPSAGVTSLDRSSVASNDSGLLSGDWGNVVCGIQVAVLSHHALQVRRLPGSMYTGFVELSAR